jgi:hypothetical protein
MFIPFGFGFRRNKIFTEFHTAKADKYPDDVTAQPLNPELIRMQK